MGTGQKPLYVQFLEYLEKDKFRSSFTIRAYRSDLIICADFLREKGVAGDMDARLIAAGGTQLKEFFEDRVGKSQAQATVYRKMFALKSFYGWAREKKRAVLNVDNPMAFLSSLTPPKRLGIKILGHSDVVKVLEMPNTRTFLGSRDRAMLHLMFATGIRPSELLALKLDTLRLSKGEPAVKIPGARARTLRLTPEVRDSLKRYLRCRKNRNKKKIIRSRLLFLNKHYMPLADRSLRRKIDKYVEMASLSQFVCPNTIRHTFAIEQLMNGTSMDDLNRLLGNRANSESSAIYTMVVAKLRSESVEGGAAA